MYKKKPKLCIITNRYPTNPNDTASPFVRDFHLALLNRGVDVVVHTPAYPTPFVETPPKVYRFEWGGEETTIGGVNLGTVKGLYQLYNFVTEGRYSLFSWIERERPTHCLALWALPSGWFAQQVKKEFGIPYSVWCLGSDINTWAQKPFFGAMTNKVLQKADYLFADGFELGTKVTQLCGKPCTFLPSQRVLPKTNIGKVSPVDTKLHNYLYFGRWEESKGAFDLINAFHLVAQKDSSARLHLLGWGSALGRMQDLISALGLEAKIKMVGKVPAPTLSSYLKNCDWVVIPSHADSIPLVFSEALQFGKPVVATEVGDLGNLTRRFGVGRVVRAGRVEDLAGAMLQIAKDRKDYTKRMPEALNLLSTDQAVETFVKLLSWDLISKPASKRDMASTFA